MPSWQPHTDFLSILSAQPFTLLHCLLAHPSCSPALSPQGALCCLSARFLLIHPLCWWCLLVGHPRSGAVAEGGEQGIVTRNNHFITNSMDCFSMFLFFLRCPSTLCFLHSPCAVLRTRSQLQFSAYSPKARGCITAALGRMVQTFRCMQSSESPHLALSQAGRRPRSERMSRKKQKVAQRLRRISTLRPSWVRDEHSKGCEWAQLQQRDPQVSRVGSSTAGMGICGHPPICSSGSVQLN